MSNESRGGIGVGRRLGYLRAFSSNGTPSPAFRSSSASRMSWMKEGGRPGLDLAMRAKLVFSPEANFLSMDFGFHESQLQLAKA